MENEENMELGTYILRGGEKLKIAKIPDRFTLRLKSRESPVAVENSYNTMHRRSLSRQRLEEFSVDSEDLDTVMDRVRRGDEVEFASHVYSFENDPESRLYLTDEITVQFKPDVQDEEIESLVSEFGLSLVKEVRGVPDAYVFRLTSAAKENPIKISNRLIEMDKVLVSEPNIAFEVKNYYMPSDSLFSNQWHLHHTGGALLTEGSHVDAVRAWDITKGERAIVVAVADDSVDLMHTDFQGEGKIVSPRDFGGYDFDPQPELEEDNHGTSCAGVAVAEENGHGVIGVAPGCALMPIRTSGEIDDNSIEDLCDWVIEYGASVLSCSWSATAVYFSLSLRMRSALHRFATLGRNGLGGVIVFAAGNENRPVNGVVDERWWPNNELRGSTHWLNGFAVHEDVIAVAACTSKAKKALYSNWGEEISVCAPSNNAPPDSYPYISSSVLGRGIWTTDRVGPSGYSSTDYTSDFGGTSSSCPLVAGIAALMLSANPNLTAREVKEILEMTADKIVDLDEDPQLRLSFGTYDENGHSLWFGYGKVNAFRAVSEAIRRMPDPGTVQNFQRSSAPGLSIPDNDASGIRDKIHFTEAANLSSIKVHVDITHTYIGDLRLTLTAPSGDPVVLHNRNGGYSDDIRCVFDSTTSPGLSALVSKPIQGDWTLLVQDLARIDVGKLNSWGLEIEGTVKDIVELDDTPGETIPDNDPNGIERTLTTEKSALAKRVEVTVDITHNYIGDLDVNLVSPNGTNIVLHHRTGGATDNLITTYTPATTSELQKLRGENIQGTWKLKIVDLARLDRGKLNKWALRIICES